MDQEPREIVIATGNPHKVEEMRAILGSAAASAGFGIVGLRDLEARGLGPFEEPEEIGETFEHNAAIKALAYAEQTGRVCVADDSGLEIDALDGAPGVISSHYFNDGRTDGAAGGMGRDERDRRNNERVLRELAGVEWERRAARFVCVMVVARGARSRNQLGLRAFRPAPSPTRGGGAFQPRPASARGDSPETPAPTHRVRRPPHFEIPGGTYFLTFRLAAGELSASERDIVLDACRHWHGERAWIHAAVVMPDHVHLILRTRRQTDGTWPTLASLMQSIKGYSAHEVNLSRGVAGTLWQAGYHDYLLWSRSHIEQKLADVQMNPVRAGLCRKPGEYRHLWLQAAPGVGLESPTPSAGGAAGRGEQRRAPIEMEAGQTEAGSRSGVLAMVRGTFEGRIGFHAGQTDRAALVVPRGTNGFGYDPLFLVESGFERTSAEMEAAEKNMVSHRARAGEQLAAWLREGGLDG
ncbi:MAG: non-canonical purine NTP pyrophosphatase [Phycisphaerales bacterium]